MRREEDRSRSRTLTWLVGIIAAVCLIWIVRAAAIVVMPVVAAFFIAIVMYPVQTYLDRKLSRHRWAALPLTMALLVAVIGGGIWALAESIDEAVEAAPRYSGQVQTMWRTVQEQAQSYGVPLPNNLLRSADVQQRLTDLATSVARAGWETVSGLILVFFLVVLMLLEAPVWSANTRRVLRDERGRDTLNLVAEVSEKVRGYLYVRTILGLMSAGAAAVWLLLLDVDLVLVWVVLTFLLNYIPNIGSIIAVLPPSLMALLQYGPTWGLVTLGGLAVIEQIIGNFIDPRMQGQRLQISPVIVLVALVFWTWVWGPVGALLAVPVTVTLLAAAAYVPSLSPFATLAAAERHERIGEDRGDRRAA